MNKVQLKNRLIQEEINPEYYNIYGVGESKYGLQKSLADYQFVLDKENDKWIVFYYERGIKSSMTTFYNESDACNYLLEMILKYRDELRKR